MKLSVLLPVYNAGDLLERAIDSILSQDFTDFEFIIINDCSKDDSASVILRAAARDPRIKAVMHEKNMGLAETLNEGLRMASTPYVVRMDQDDESLPSRLRTQYVFLKSRPHVAAAGSFACHMGTSPEKDRLVRLPHEAADVKQALQSYNCLYHPSVILNREMALKAGGYRPEFNNSEDYDLWLRLSTEHDLMNIPVPLLRYHFTVTGMTLSRKWEQLYYVFLAQASARNPGKPWPEVERIAKEMHQQQDKEEFLSNVLRDTMNELLALGWKDEARQLVEHFTNDLGREKTEQISAALLVDPPQSEQEGSSGALDPGYSSTAYAKAATPPRKRRFKFPLGRPRFGFLVYKRNENEREKSLDAWMLPALLGLLLPTIFWIVRDEHVWPWDQAWYGEVSVGLWFQFTHHLSKWLPAMVHAFGTKAPGVAWLGQFFVPLGLLMGSIEKGLLCSVLLVQAGTLAFIYSIGKVYGRGRSLISFGGMLAAASAPLFIAMSHQYFVEGLQTFGVAWFYFLAMKAPGMKREKLLANLLIATSIALLAKVTSPIYCLLPGAMAAWSLFQKRENPENKRFRLKGSALGLLIVAVILTAGCAAWYAVNFQTLRNFVKLSSSGDVALAYGSRAAFLPKLYFWLHAAQISFLMPEVIVGGLVLIAIAVAVFLSCRTRKKVAKSDRRGSLNLLAAFSALHIAGVLALFSLNINEENRYLLPLTPAVATVTVWVLARIRRPTIIAGFVVLFGYQWLFTFSQALGFISQNPGISYWVKPYDHNEAAEKEVTRLVDLTSNAQTASRYNIVGVELPWLNANSLAFYAAKKQLVSRRRCEYTSLGYAEGDAGKAWSRLESLHVVYFISLRESAQPGPDIFNMVSSSVLKRVREDRTFTMEPFDSKLGILVFRRHAVAPVSFSN